MARTLPEAVEHGWKSGWSGSMPTEAPPVPDALREACSDVSPNRAYGMARLSGFRAAVDEGRRLERVARGKTREQVEAIRRLQVLTQSRNLDQAHGTAISMISLLRPLVRPSQQLLLDALVARIEGQTIRAYAQNLGLGEALAQKRSQRGLALLVRHGMPRDAAVDMRHAWRSCSSCRVRHETST